MEEDNYQFYDEDNEQLIIGKIKDKSQQWIWQLLFSDDLTRSSHLSWDEIHRRIHIKYNPSAHSTDMNIDIELTLNVDFLPVKVLQKDSSGARIVYYFLEYTPHINIPADAFQLKVPEDIEIIREES